MWVVAHGYGSPFLVFFLFFAVLRAFFSPVNPTTERASSGDVAQLGRAPADTVTHPDVRGVIVEPSVASLLVVNADSLCCGP